MSAKKFFTADKKQGPLSSNLNQVIDIIQEDVSGSATRRKYQTFVTGGIGPGVTSSLYQTIYDQDFTLQTANAVADMTVGLFHYDDGTESRKNLVTINSETGYTRFDNGQITFDTKHTMMMREKVNVYRQYAKLLLGDADKPFCLDGAGGNNKNTIDKENSTGVNQWKDSPVIMDACVFVNVKRLFARDSLRPETFAMRLYERAPQWNDELYPEHTTATNIWKPDFVPYHDGSNYGAPAHSSNNNQAYYRWDGTDRFNAMTNLFGGDVNSSVYGVQIIADIGGNPAQVSSFGSRWSYLKLASDTTKLVGLIFYDAGIAVLNLGTSTQASTVSWGSTLTDLNNPNGNKYKHALANGGDAGLGGLLTMKPVFAPYDRINGVLSGMSADYTDTAQKGWQGNNAQAAGQVFIGRVDGQADANTIVLNAGSGFANSLRKHEKADVGGSFNGATISGRATNLTTYNAGVEYQQSLSSAGNGPKVNPNAQFYPDLLVSGSMDDIIDHIGFTRFSSGSLTACAFQNSTKIQSSIFFCRAAASQFNGSSNPTWSETNPNSQDETQWLLTSTSDQNRPYTYITTVLLYDSSDELVAVAKLNRPIEKNSESELTVRVRLDF